MATQVTLNSGSVDSAGSLAFKTNGTTTAVTINSSQGVEFNAGAVGTPSITTTGDTNTGIFFPAADTIAFSEGGAEVMRIDSAGNVGIGTASPISVGGKTLQVENSTIAAILWSDGTRTGELLASAAAGVTVGSRSNHALQFATNDTERMRIDTSGRLFVNQTAQSGNTAQRMGLTFASNVEWGLNITSSSTSTGNAINFTNSSGTQIGQIQTSTTATAYVTSSDYRLKEDIAPMTGALEKISLLKPVTYKWKSTGDVTQGFIAHELQEIIPECATGTKDAVDENGNPVYQGIDTSFLVATLTAAIQEQQALITALTARITALEAT